MLRSSCLLGLFMPRTFQLIILAIRGNRSVSPFCVISLYQVFFQKDLKGVRPNLICYWFHCPCIWISNCVSKCHSLKLISCCSSRLFLTSILALCILFVFYPLFLMLHFLPLTMVSCMSKHQTFRTFQRFPFIMHFLPNENILFIGEINIIWKTFIQRHLNQESGISQHSSGRG